jgi:hypothetical protein
LAKAKSTTIEIPTISTIQPNLAPVLVPHSRGGKKCPRCGVSKPWSEFYISRTRNKKYTSYCKKCCCDPARQKDRVYRENPNSRRKRLFERYGLSIEKYDAMNSEQGGVCAICHKKTLKRLSVDHNHITGKIRGLLCAECNYGLGMFQDNADNLRRASRYLDEANG